MHIEIWGISVCLILLLGFPGKASAQIISDDFLIQRWDVEAGLPVNEVIDIETTSDGYVWLTTLDGLVRFDSNRFTIFNKGQYPEMVSNRLQLLFNRNGNLWMKPEAVGGNEYLIRYKENEFKSFGPEEGLGGRIFYIWSSEDGIWVSGEGKMKEFKNGRFEPFLEDEITETISIFTFLNDGSLWMISSKGKLLSYIDGERKEYTTDDGLWNNRVLNLQKSLDGKIWIITDSGINLIENSIISKMDIPIRIDGFEVAQLYVDVTNSERIFIVTKGWNRLYSYYQGETQRIPDKKEGLGDFELQGIEAQSTDKKWAAVGNALFYQGKLVYLHNTRIHNVLESNDRGLWFGSSNGLFFISRKLFKSYDLESHGVSNVYPVTQDHEGTVWTADLYGNIFKFLDDEFVKPFTPPEEISGNRVFSIAEDDKNTMWFGYTYGALKWDRVNEPEIVFSPYEEFNAQIRAVFQSKNRDMWFGGFNGLFRKDSSDQWTFLREADGFELKGTRVIYETADGTIWFGTNGNGLFFYKNDTLHSFNGNARLSDNIVRSIYEDSEGILWVGMEGGGLNRIERPLEEPIITHYGLDDGLFDTVIHTILEDKRSRFWMSGNRGIFWVPKASLNAFASGEIESIHSTYYSVMDGLPGNEANGGMQSTGYITEDSTFLFPMVKGLASIKANNVGYESGVAQVLIEELTSGDLKIPFPENSPELNREHRNVQFTYTSINYRVNPESISFRHRLSDNTDEWVNAGPRRDAFYTNISGGLHVFEVQASLDGNNWGESTTLEFYVPPYFYETGWFRILVGFIVLCLGYVLVQFRVRQVELREKKLIKLVDEQTNQLKAQAERLQELDKAKSRFFANISHEFRTPLTLTIGPLEDITKSNEGTALGWIKEKSNLALRNSKRLLRLVNQILDIAKIESGNLTIKTQKKDITSFIQPIAQAFLSLAERKKVTFTTQFPEQRLYMWFDEDMMEKIIANLLANAFKFTNAGGEVSLIILVKGNQISITVSDTGIGIPEEDLAHVFDRFYQTGESRSIVQAGTGIGLSLVRELVELHQGVISAESTVGEGTSFNLSFKKGRGHFTDDQVLEKNFSGEEMEVEIEAEDLAAYDIADPLDFETTDEADQPKVLIVDDSAEIREYIRESIKDNYQVIESDNGASGLELARNELPDIIISDVMMPIMDGYKFTRKLKSSKETEFIPVILLTAKAEKDDKMEGLGSGANDYIVKPFDLEEVQLKIKNLIQSQKNLKARFSSRIFEFDAEIDSPKAEFLKKAGKVLSVHFSDDQFNIEKFAEEMAMSRTVLFEKSKEFTGTTPYEFLWNIRLEQAAVLLRQQAGNITEVAYSVGFKSIAHFSRSFKKKYKVSPGNFAKEQASGSK